MELVSLSPEGRILLTLKHGKHTYSELRFETGLSDRWLTIKLGELNRKGVVEKKGRWYGLSGKLEVSGYELGLFMSLQAERMADELAKLHSIRMILLFGSVTQKKACEYSDLDMVIVVSGKANKVKKEIISRISRMELKYHMTVEPLILTEETFLDNIHSPEDGIIYGIAEGYEVLVDKTGQLGEELHSRIQEIKCSHDYLEEEGIWLKAK